METYFSLLGLQPAFNLDSAALEAAYFKAQRQYHPDRFVAKSTAERQQALQKSVDINQAYETLKNPLKRAQYLLHLQGIKVGTDKDSIKPSQALLNEILEWREEAENVKELPRLESMLKTEYDQALQTLSETYRLQDWDVMAQESLRLGYIIKTHAEIAQKKRSL